MNEIRENIQGLFDYCGDVKKNSNNLRSAQYSLDYSPNNIKTVVISAEGILIRLHKSYTGRLPKGVTRLGSKVLYIMYNPLRLYKQDENGSIDFGVSFFKMLVRPLVCASIEEIIILQGVTDNNYRQFVDYINSYEVLKEDLLLGFKKTGNTQSDIAERFGRLYRISTVNLNFISFLNGYRQNKELFEKSNFLCDCMSNYIIISDIYNEEWWNGIKVQTSTYALDIELKTYFESIKNKYDKVSKDAKIQASKEQLYKKEIEGLDFAIKRYVSLCSIPMKMRAIVANGESSGVVSNLSYPILQYDKLVDCPGFPKGIRESFIDNELKLSAKDAIKHNRDVTSSISKIVTLTSKAFIETLYKVHEESPVTFRIIMKKLKEHFYNGKIAIIVPTESRHMIEEMKSDMNGLNIDCDGKFMARSIVNAVWLYNLCFIENNANTSKYNDVTTWSNMVVKKEDK